MSANLPTNRFHMSELVMTHAAAAPLEEKHMNEKQETGKNFHAGEAVFLALGTYQGTSGEFVRFCEDRNWAVIKQIDGEVRNHPVAWLGHSPA